MKRMDDRHWRKSRRRFAPPSDHRASWRGGSRSNAAGGLRSLAHRELVRAVVCHRQPTFVHLAAQVWAAGIDNKLIGSGVIVTVEQLSAPEHLACGRFGFFGFGQPQRGDPGLSPLQPTSLQSPDACFIPIVSIVVPFFRLTMQLYIQDFIRYPQKGTTMETIGTLGP